MSRNENWSNRQRKRLCDAIEDNENYINNTTAYVTVLMTLMVVVFAGTRNCINNTDLMRAGIILCIMSQISNCLSCFVVNMICRNTITLIDEGVDDADIYKKVKKIIRISDSFNMATVFTAITGFIAIAVFIALNL